MSKIVVADDEAELAAAIAERLGTEQFECIIASDGQEALDITKRELPEVIILDIMLPKLSGYEVCRRMLRDPQMYTTPILVLTALSDEPELLHALEQGADDVIAKPFRFDDLLRKVRGLVATRRSLNQLDPVLGLAGTDAVKRYINHRLARDEQIGVCYLEILHAQAFRHAHGSEPYMEAVKLGADTLKETRHDMEFFESFLGYVGNENFVAVMNIDQYEPYCRTVLSRFEQRIQLLYRPAERKQGYIVYCNGNGRESRAPMMRFWVGVVHNQHRRFHSANSIFQTLARLKGKIGEHPHGGMFIDRRCLGR